MQDRDVLQALTKPDLWKIFEHHADKLGVRVEVANHLAKVAACPSEKIVRGCPIRGKFISGGDSSMNLGISLP